MKRAEIYLVPGFLGFDALAELDYWEGVQAVLERKLAARGVELVVHATETVPAGSLTKRARKLAEVLAEKHDLACDSVHLLGHSTGGVDVRLLLSPGGAFDVGGEVAASMSEGAAERYRHALEHTRTAMSLATPHDGTPAAEVLMKIGLDRMLRDAASLDGSSLGRALVGSGLAFASSVASMLTAVGLAPGFLRWVNTTVLSRPPASVLAYLHAIGEDLGALRSLTQEAMALFDAAVLDRPGVDYVCFLTGTDRPAGPVGTRDPFIASNTRIFRALWDRVARRDPAYPYAPAARAEQARALHRAGVEAGLDVGELTIDERTNDGLVPTLSQIHGRIGLVVASDHLDCVGMFPRDAPGAAYRSGWVRSGAHFRESRLELLWGRVADAIAAHRVEPVASEPTPPRRQQARPAVASDVEVVE
jgi:hypothetical protein